MCNNAAIGRQTVRPGDLIPVYSKAGSRLANWGIGRAHNSRVESFLKTWRNYDRIYCKLTEFYESDVLFRVEDLKHIPIAGMFDGVNFTLMTRSALGIVLPYHKRMPVILAEPEEFLISGRIIEIDYNRLRYAA